jgi:hypothetical protein
MTSYLYQNNIKIFDYPDWANALREELRELKLGYLPVY